MNELSNQLTCAIPTSMASASHGPRRLALAAMFLQLWVLQPSSQRLEIRDASHPTAVEHPGEPKAIGIENSISKLFSMVDMGLIRVTSIFLHILAKA